MEHENKILMPKRFLLAIWLTLTLAVISAQSGSVVLSQNNPVHADTADHGKNELTIYVIPALVKYDWTSPYSLYKSYYRNYKRNLFKKDKYLLGHAFAELRSPLVSGGIFTGMRVTSRKEQKNLVLKQHYGLAILGADMAGELEIAADLEPIVEKFSRKGQLAFMTFIINDEAAERIIRFFQAYEAGIDSIGSPGARYGGAFWPRYRGEGSGCSAFVVSFLDLAGLLREEFDEWLVKIDIPMDLIGGPYNHFNEVSFSDIKKHKSWTGIDGSDMGSYEHLEIYDPTLMYEWIKEKWSEPEFSNTLVMKPLQLNKARGIMLDCHSLLVPEEESIFMERKKPSIFIDYYRQK